MELHEASINQLIKLLHTDLSRGLNSELIEKHRTLYGPNVLKEKRQTPWVFVFLSQFKSPLIYILLIAASIIYFFGPDKLDAFIISGVLLFNALIGTIQEGRTRTLLASLKKFIISDCVVVRDGKKLLIDNVDLVVGDIILVQEGQRVPADARIVESNNIQVDESMLTGESNPVIKSSDDVQDEASLQERTNMLFKGTYILAGSGRALVIATGASTMIGKIHKETEEIQADTPLKKEVDRLSYIILMGIFALCIMLFSIGYFTGKPLNDLLVMLTALFICVVPEGLPVVLTLVLVAGVHRMAKQKVLVKNMQAVEALGRADIILLDKTGTLTRNEMMVTHAWADDAYYTVSGVGYHPEGAIMSQGKPIAIQLQPTDLQTMAIAAALLNSSQVSYDSKTELFSVKGDPTESAMDVFSQKLSRDHDQLSKIYKKLYELPFESQTQYHAGFFEHDNQGVAFMIGSPEAILMRAGNQSAAATQALAQLLEQGLRVVAVGVKNFALADTPSDAQAESAFFKNIIKSDIRLLGLCGMEDAIRPEVQGIIAQTRNAGLKVIMVTGDHKKTAEHVAQQVGIYTSGDTIMEGAELTLISDDELIRVLNSVTVFARVTPEQKLRIIKVYHKLSKIVAMTGDGINDAPSLVAADLGIAMGQIGTEVAKQASDVILLNDSFVYVVKAIEQGRHIFYTLRRVVLYFFATNMAEILIVLFALSFMLPVPITAAQILWLNLVTDGFLDIALSLEPEEAGLLDARWLARKRRLVDGALLSKTLFMAVPMAVGSLLVFYANYTVDLTYARTMTLLTMAMYQWFNAWNCRSERLSILQSGLFTNRWLLVATTFVLLLQIMLIYAPFMHTIFKTVPLTWSDWRIVLSITFPIIIIEEVRKFVMRNWSGNTH